MKTIKTRLDENVKENLEKFFNSSIETQNFLFYKRYLTQFIEKILIKDDESIKYISKHNEIKKGLNNYYVKCTSKIGFTFNLKGNTNNRLKIWNNNNNKYNNLHLVKQAIIDFPDAFETNDTFLNIISENIIHFELCTQGALSRILCNKIKNLNELYEYYFTYGLRGYGLYKTENNIKAFRELVEKTESLHLAKSLLHSSIDPNEFFQNDWRSFVEQPDFKTFVYQHLFDQLTALSKKVNWLSVDLEKINKIVQEEIDKNHQISTFFDKGFELDALANFTCKITDLEQEVDLPF